jgi:2-C-methyl-D-erythritol 4-phosphate cytidylyltransferase
MSKPRYWAVMPAAGVGRRMGGSSPKQYLPLLDSTVIEFALRPLLNHPLIERVIVVLSASDSEFQALPLAKHPKIQCVTGGAERADSVLAGLKALLNMAADNDVVFVHDAARPCLTLGDIDLLIETLSSGGDGAILAQPVVETVKLSDKNGNIEQTLDRQRVFLAQTPQCFALRALYEGYERARQEGWIATDEASIFEKLGRQPKLVSGPRRNIKITHPDDLALASFYLQVENSLCE